MVRHTPINLDDYEVQLRGSVRLGQVFIPVINASDVVSRYCRQLIVENDDESHPYSLLGSSGMLKINGAFRQIFCRHQIAERNCEDVRLLPYSDPSKMIRGYQFDRSSAPTIDEEVDDICSFLYRPRAYNISNFESDFFNVYQEECWPRNSTNYFCIIGYPNKKDAIALNEDGYATGITATVRTIGGHYDGATGVTHLHRIRLKESGRGIMDGFSGGVVFHLARDSTGFFWGFAGVLTRSADASEFAHFIEANFLLSLYA